MIKTKTVFILGAGASWPYNYPTGQELRKSICINDIIRIRTPQIIKELEYQIENIRRSFENSGNESIDLFLARNHECENIGKLLIVAHILSAEYSSTFNERMPENKKNQDWYKYLFGRMTSKLTNPDSYKKFNQNNVSFITFNYDRSLEYYMSNALRNSFSKAPSGEITEQIKSMPIYHVYGKVAGLEYEDGPAVQYGRIQSTVYEEILNLTKNIRVVFERTNHEVEKIKNVISEAKRVFFLGFGFAPENLEAIGIPEVFGKEKEIWGTAYGLLDEEIKRIRYKIGKELSVPPSHVASLYPIIENIDIVTLLRKYLED